MEKRVFLAILISFGILAVYQAYFAPPPPAPPAPSAVSAPSTPPVPAASNSVAPASPVQSAAPTPGAAPAVPDTAARDILVDTDTVSAVFTTRGGVLKSWKLKRYHGEDGKPLELIPQNLPETFERPFALAVDDANVSAVLRSAVYQTSTESLTLGAGSGTLEFVYNDGTTTVARKRLQFQPDGKAYFVSVDASVTVGGKPQPVIVHWGPAVGRGYPDAGQQEFPTRAIQLTDSVARIAASDLEAQKRYETVVRFAGVEDQYFLSAVLPAEARQGQAVRIDYQPFALPVMNDPQNRTRALIAYSVRTPGPASVGFFVGPKELNIVRAVNPELTDAIDFGMFRFLVVPLLQALNGINRYLGNYGWSIVALTVFINLLIFPFRHKSMVSMRKMQAIQPEVKAIQERYAKYKITDPERQKMNQEMMALYKQRGVNPASGCVPMLATMPVLFAFYAMLSASIELRGAPFFGWLTDLSVQDPYYITPVLMGGTMFWQQKMMPSTADPLQQKMFLLMPIIFTAMFLAAPSGLVVYWLVSNLLAIGQQYITNRMIGAPPPRPLATIESKKR